MLAQSVPGWTATVVTTYLATPIHTDDGDVSDIVTQVTWTADNAANGIKPGEFGKFEIIVGSLPSTGNQIAFKALQTHSNGDVVKWIDPVTTNGPPADHPTPILTPREPHHHPGRVGNTHDHSRRRSALPTHVASTSDTDTAKTLGIIAIVLAVLALIGIAILLLRKRPA